MEEKSCQCISQEDLLWWDVKHSSMVDPGYFSKWCSRPLALQVRYRQPLGFRKSDSCSFKVDFAYSEFLNQIHVDLNISEFSSWEYHTYDLHMLQNAWNCVFFLVGQFDRKLEGIDGCLKLLGAMARRQTTGHDRLTGEALVDGCQIWCKCVCYKEIYCIYTYSLSSTGTYIDIDSVYALDIGINT